MSPDESGTQSPDGSAPDVESLLKQMNLRGPSDQLDVAIGSLTVANELDDRRLANGVRFGWTAILATAAAAMLAGVWLVYSLAPTGGKLPESNLIAGDSSDTRQRTLVSFNERAFNLLHGHSQRAEFENCSQCHQPSVTKGSKLTKIFQGWFYGDEHFFEAHPHGLDDCSKCHVVATDEWNEYGKGLTHSFFAKHVDCSSCHKVDADEGHELGKGLPHSFFAKHIDCSNCHKVDADGFDGFKKDWLSATSYEG